MRAYHAAERKLYAQHELQASVWARCASKFWSKIANLDGTINSNYGYLTGGLCDTPDGWTQWEWAKMSLQRDPDTRQAVMHFNRPRHQIFGIKDFPCTISGTFLIREGRLEYSVLMRSQDIIKGMPYDLPFFMSQQIRMASELGVTVGMYTHFVHSLHVYERDLDKVERMIFTP